MIDILTLLVMKQIEGYTSDVWKNRRIALQLVPRERNGNEPL
jgi:hypothetical protein